ncbi:MAG: sugar ABC transporter permease [Chloroflexi bacterium]|nr:sugar ABC transporter permease [Chloroflexota bacterium]
MQATHPLDRAGQARSTRDWSIPDRWLAHLLLWPAFLTLFGVFAYPLAYSFWLSLHVYNLTRPPVFNGIDNYLLIVQDMRVWESFAVSVQFAAISLALQLVFGFGIALLLARVVLFRGLIRTIIIIPLMLTPVVLGLNWKLMLNLDWGIINYFLRLLGFSAVNFVNNPSTAMASLILVDVWHTTSFTVLVLSAGLASLPDEPFEAASIDGASGWQKLWYLTLPLLRPLFLVIILFRSYELIRVYDIIFAVTGGGPGRVTETISFHIFSRMFQGFQLGYASAISYVLFAVCLAWSILIIKTVGTHGAAD